MNICTLIDARRSIDAYQPLWLSLRSWWKSRNIAPEASAYDFGDWLLWLLGEIYEKIGIDSPSANDLVEAVSVNSMGDFIAMEAEKTARRDGLETDTDCYVEDGNVYSSIWLKGKEAKKVEAYADRLAEMFQLCGYSSEVSIDEEDDREVSVSAWIEFSEYLKLKKNGIQPEKLFGSLSGKVV